MSLLPLGSRSSPQRILICFKHNSLRKDSLKFKIKDHSYQLLGLKSNLEILSLIFVEEVEGSPWPLLICFKEEVRFLFMSLDKLLWERQRKDSNALG